MPRSATITSARAVQLMSVALARADLSLQRHTSPETRLHDPEDSSDTVNYRTRLSEEETAGAPGKGSMQAELAEYNGSSYLFCDGCHYLPRLGLHRQLARIFSRFAFGRIVADSSWDVSP